MEKEVKIIKSQIDPLEYKFLKLKNELKCTIVYDPKTTKSCAVMNVGVGHMKDPHNCHGLAHFLEHMIFMGNRQNKINH